MRRTATLLFSFILILVVLLASYELATLFALYSTEQQKVINYVHGRGQLSGFTMAEIEHLNDVKRVMTWARLTLVLGLAAAILGRDNEFFFAGVLGVIGMSAILIMALLSFDYVFYLFHRILFAPGSWIFSSESRLIQMFPIDFFILMAKRIFLSALGIYLVLAGTGYLMKNSRMIKKT